MKLKIVHKIIIVLLYAFILFMIFSPALLYSGGTVSEETMFSTSLNKNVTYKIYLPEGYDPNGTTTYRVIYFLNGAALSYDFYQFINGIVDTLIMEKKIQPVILVYENGLCQPYAGSFYTNSILYGKYEDFTYIDMVQYIDSHYKTKANKDSRGIMGHSMGGYGCMKMLLKHPDVYRAAASHSGTLDFYNFQPNINMVLYECHGGPPYLYHPANGFGSYIAFTMCGAFTPNILNPPFYVDFILDQNGNIIQSIYDKFLKNSVGFYANNYNPESNSAIYFDCGYQDQYGLYSWNNNFRDTLNLRGIPYTYKPFTGNHTGLLHTRIPISMHFLDSAMNASVADEMVGVLTTKVISFNIQQGIKTALIAKLNSALGSLGAEDTASACISLQDFINFAEAQKDKFITISQADELIDDAIEIRLDLGCGTDAITEERLTPSKYALLQNYPNPFNPVTTINYQLPINGSVKLTIFDILGKEIAVLVNERQNAGSYNVQWNASNYPSGVYFYKLVAGNFADTKKMMLIK